MGIRFDSNKFMSELQKFEHAVDAGLQAIGNEVANQADRDMQNYLFLSVYGTVPGRIYERTGNLKSFANTHAEKQVGNISEISIKLSSGADYASDIEYGRGTFKLTEGMIQKLSESSQGEGLYLGRTGQQYLVPGPFIMPSAVKARIKLEKEFESLIRRTWR